MPFRTSATFLALFSLWLLLISSHKDPNNPPTARTGAPGETTCAASGCHNGGAFTGTVNISGVPDTAVYGQTYTLTLTNASNATRAGFQLTCLDGSNAKCGTLTAGTGTSVATATITGRQYVRQSSPKTLSGGMASWNFTWKAPTTASGGVGKFYFVSLCANGNGKESGDNVVTNTKSIVFKSAVGTDEPDLGQEVRLYPTPAHDVLHVDFQQVQAGQITLLDLSGKPVLQQTLSATNQLDVSQLSPGAYLARIRAGQRETVLKFLIR